MLRRILIRFLHDQSGATAIEYALIGVLVSVGIIAAVTVVGGQVSSLFGRVETKTTSVITAAGG
jgi:pilus assembly protein Flp/PilA